MVAVVVSSVFDPVVLGSVVLSVASVFSVGCTVLSVGVIVGFAVLAKQ